MQKRIIVGTRASKLAMIQTQWVIDRLRQQWPNLEIVIEQIRTTGDRITDVPLSRIGGDGVFVTEIERALRERRIDLAVHSLKDLPTAQPEGLRIVAAGPREDVRDVFISNKAVQLVDGKLHATSVSGDAVRIGTGSLRRIAQLRQICPDAQILPIRGNVDTRLRKLDAGEYDGIVLAAAGLHRLEMQASLAERLTYFPIDLLLPAPGQAAIALEFRQEPEMQQLVVPLQDRIVQAATCAERMFMRHLGAGCYLPIAAHGVLEDGWLTLSGLVISLDGQRQVHVHQRVPWMTGTDMVFAELLGIRLAEEALTLGADEIIEEVNRQREQEQQHV